MGLLSNINLLSPVTAIGSVLQNTASASKDPSKGLAAVAGTWGNLLSNIGTGKILTPSAEAHTGIQVIDKILTASTTPAGIAVIAGVGAGAVTAVKAAIGGQTAVAKTVGGAAATGGAGAAGSAAMGNKSGSQASSQPIPSAADSLPKTVSQASPVTPNANERLIDTAGKMKDTTVAGDKIPVPNIPKTNEPKPTTGGQTVQTPSGSLLDTAKDIGNKQLTTTLNSGTDKKNTSTSGSKATSVKKTAAKKTTTKKKTTAKKKTTPKKAKTSKATKSKAKKSSSKKQKYKAPSRYGSGKQYSKKGGKDVYYTKTGQPYILMASGKAKFIKR
jgi:hypothetical protein